MNEPVKGTPRKQLFLGLVLIVLAVIIGISAGPSAEFLKQNQKWWDWLPWKAELESHLKGLPTVLMMFSLSMLGWGLKTSWAGVSGWITGRGKTDIPNLVDTPRPSEPPTIVTAATDTGAAINVLKTKVVKLEQENAALFDACNQWVRYGTEKQERLNELSVINGEDQKVIQYMGQQMLLRRLQTRGIFLAVIFAIGGAIAGRIQPVEIDPTAHGWALFIAFFCVGILGAIKLTKDEKLKECSARDVVGVNFFSALVCCLIYLVASYGYARVFTELVATTKAFEIKAFGDVASAALWRLIACPVAAALGASIVTYIAGRFVKAPPANAVALAICAFAVLQVGCASSAQKHSSYHGEYVITLYRDGSGYIHPPTFYNRAPYRKIGNGSHRVLPAGYKDGLSLRTLWNNLGAPDSRSRRRLVYWVE